MTTTMTTAAKFSGVEAFLVGISPTYWAHVPMSIAQVHNLHLVDGIHCMMVHDDIDNSNNNNDTSSKESSSYPMAVSKCLLMGMVVIVERRPGSIIFVLDDGTGLIDCLLWTDRDIFELPSLTGEPNIQRHSEQEQQQPYVGQMVRVHGRIEAVSVQDVDNKGTATTTLEDSLVAGKHRQICIREIHVTLLEPIPVASEAQPHSLNAESLHWLNYCSPRRFGSYTSAAHDDSSDTSTTTTKKTPPMTMLNAAQVLDRFLGPDIAQQVARRESLPSAHDKEASWKLFGVVCRCCNITLKYKDELLYCHCLATNLSDDLDPGLVYRDALLHRLLELQQEQQQQQQPENAHNTYIKPNKPLQFHYKTVATDNQLMAVLDTMDMSTTMTTATATTASSTQQQQQHRHRRVVQKTFAALRKDGILALLCDKSDVYLLISRTLVLEPYIQTTMTRDNNSVAATKNKSTTSHHQLPEYLSNVPKARLQYVRRTMSIS